jgi:anti-sigma regulatory factor (Ser/Thr protein kinase)
VKFPYMIIEPLDLALPRDARRLRRFRAELGDWLDRAGVNDHDRDEIILAAHEAVANGIEHSDGDGELRIQAEIDDQAVTVTVTSPGPWREPDTRLGRGNGLVIIRGLTEVDIDATATSADVRMRRRLSTLR